MSQSDVDIASVELYNLRPTLFHGYILPFVLMYSFWIGYWTNVLGFQEHMELGLIVIATIGFVQIITCLCCHWFVGFKCLMTCKKQSSVAVSEYVKVVPTPNTGYPMIVRIEKQKSSLQNVTYSFNFQRLKYTFRTDEKDSYHPVEFPVDWSVKTYLGWRGHETIDQQIEAQCKYGINELHLDVPSFAELFKERATAPFFVFQVFSVGLWCLDEYWVYPLIALGMLCLFEASLVQQQLKNLSEIRSMSEKPYNIHVYRQKKWTRVKTDQLVAGDIVSISENDQKFCIPADLLLLRGTCIVDESMLTGESVPVSKDSCEILKADEQFTFDDGHKTHILFGGTKVVQFTPPSKSSNSLKAPDNGCICFVLRTGLSTSQGRLLKTIMYSVKAVTANNAESFLFIAFLLIFALIASAYVWIEGTADPRRNRYKLFLECTLILTSVIPQELPLELSLAVNSSLMALCKLLVYCTEPFRIPFAGKIDICAFDKTGTLTEDTVVVEGVTGLNDQPSNKLLQVKQCPLSTIQVLASCHSLINTSGSGLIGDPMEKAMLASTGWSLNDQNEVYGRTIPRSSPLKICQRFRFDSTLRRMSVIVSHYLPSSVDRNYLVCVKGSPETILPMLVDAPPDYEEAYLTMARRGARVLALGQKTLGQLTHEQVRDLARESVESNIQFCGFVIISCPLKPDSFTVIKDLSYSSHHISMITGDNPLTACHVSTIVGIVRSDVPVLVLSPPNPLHEQWHWQSVDESIILPIFNEKKSAKCNLSQLVNKYDVCLTGEGIDYLSRSDPNFLRQLIPKAKIYARVAPKQKESILIQLKRMGYVTLMCGDGTNDVGALKQAHVGVALLNETSTPVSPMKSADTKQVNPLSKNVRYKNHGDFFGRGKHDLNSTSANMNSNNLTTRPSFTLPVIEAEQEVSVVRLGNASIAAPFTAKMSSPIGVCHIVMQGRCTLVTTLQMYKILAINALIIAYSSSVLYLKGFKISDTQATIRALLLSACFLFISRSKPLKTLSKERPIPNIFNLYTLLTVTLQFLIHFCVLYMLTMEAELRMPKVDDDFVDLNAEFKPSILNTLVYLISTGMETVTLAVNYTGHPFMESLIENKPMLISLIIAVIGIVILPFGPFSSTLQLVDLDNDIRIIFFKALLFDFIASFMIDRVLVFIFGRVRQKSL
ncbi:Manganese-transporting ATPase 13A1 [Schistosoma japonicum]|nr:Manganese-transporting ATPase 13A1 [Schistosoma japonicum]